MYKKLSILSLTSLIVAHGSIINFSYDVENCTGQINYSYSFECEPSRGTAYSFQGKELDHKVQMEFKDLSFRLSTPQTFSADLLNDDFYPIKVLLPKNDSIISTKQDKKMRISSKNGAVDALSVVIGYTVFCKNLDKSERDLKEIQIELLQPVKIDHISIKFFGIVSGQSVKEHRGDFVDVPWKVGIVINDDTAINLEKAENSTKSKYTYMKGCYTKSSN